MTAAGATSATTMTAITAEAVATTVGRGTGTGTTDPAQNATPWAQFGPLPAACAA